MAGTSSGFYKANIREKSSHIHQPMNFFLFVYKCGIAVVGSGNVAGVAVAAAVAVAIVRATLGAIVILHGL